MKLLIVLEDLFETLAGILKEKNIERAVILSGIGSLCNVAFRDLKTGIDLPVKVDKTNLMEEYGPFELLTLEGNVVPLVGEFANLKDGDPVTHLHCTLGTAYGNLFGGHLFKATVFTTTELFLAMIKNSEVKKKQSTVEIKVKQQKSIYPTTKTSILNNYETKDIAKKKNTKYK